MFSGSFRLSEDDDDFSGDVESSRSNLSNIFGVPPLQNEDNSLKYVPPKQESQTKDPLRGDKATWNVQVAKVVLAYKLVNQANILEGKLGLALLKSADGLYKIILYRSKNEVLSTFTIVENALVFVKNSYFQFRDDLQVFWSVLFENGGEHEIIALIKDKVNIEEHKEVSNCPKNEAPTEESKGEMLKSEHAVETGVNSSDERLKQTKAQILSRMAKMGKPLPNLRNTTTTDFSDSSDTEVKTKLITKPVAVPRKPNRQQLSTAVSNNAQVIPAATNLAAYNPNWNMEAQCLNMLLAENRTQNAEIRINISKLEAKIEKVLDKVDMVSSRGTTVSEKCKDDEVLELEEKLLSLKKENRSLKVKIEELSKESTKAVKVKESIENVISEFRDLIELFGINTEEYKTTRDLLKDLIRKYRLHCESLQSTIDSSKVLLEDYEHRIEVLDLDGEEKLSKLLEENEKLKANICDMEQKLEKLETENKDLAAKNQSDLPVEGKLDNAIKDIMNNLYQILMVKFGDKKTFTSTEVLRICGSAIKEETNNMISERNCNSK